MKELILKIEQWAEDRNIIKGSKPIDQAMKLFSEFGELADNVGKGRDCRDDIGDVFVVLTIITKQQGDSIIDFIDESPWDYSHVSCKKSLVEYLCMGLALFSGEYSDNKAGDCIANLERICDLHGYTLEECVQIAYDDIKNRKGIMSNGVFIKESDPAYESVIKAIEVNCGE